MEITERLRYGKNLYGTNDWWIDVTDITLGFFGSAVKKVEMSCEGYYNREKAVKESTGILEKARQQMAEGKEFEFDRRSLMLTFSDGRSVIIWNSEWGGIQRM